MHSELNIFIPESFIITTGEDEYINEKTNHFFESVLDVLSYNLAARKAFVEQRTQTLGIEEPNGFRPSDNKITLLIARDLTIASVLERRDDLNYIEVSFAHYLNKHRVERLQQGFPIS
jgi:hypothetical protein